MLTRRPIHLVLGLSLLAVGAVSSVAQAAVSLPASCDRSEPSVSDFDGDGIADAVVGSPVATSDGAIEAGVVTVVYGTRHGWVPERAENIVPGSTGVPGSPRAKARFGEAVDVSFLDDDDCADVIIGAPGTKTAGKKAAGVAYIVFGAPGGLGLGKPGLQIRAGSPGVPGSPAIEDRFGGIITSNQGLVANHLIAFGMPAVDAGGEANSGAVIVVQIGSDGAPVSGEGRKITQDTPGIPDDSGAGDRFGQAVAIGDPQTEDSLGTVFVGAPGDDLGEENESGALTVIDGPNLSPLQAERWIQGQAPLGDTPENLDRLGNSVAYGADPVTGQIGLLVASPGEEVGDVHEAGSAFLFDGCTKLAECAVTYLTQGSGPVSDTPEREDRFGTRLAFAPTRTTQGGLFAIIGSPGEAIGTANDAGMVQMIDTEDHTTVYPPIDESLAEIPGEAEEGDRFGDSITAVAYTARGWLGMMVVGVSRRDVGGDGVVVTLPFAPPGTTGPATKARLWAPGQGAIPPVDLGFGTATGGMGR